MAGNPIVRAVADFVSVLDELGIRYGALCTEEIDLVAHLAPGQTGLLASKLNTDFYADAGQMREAIRYGAAFQRNSLRNGVQDRCLSIAQGRLPRGRNGAIRKAGVGSRSHRQCGAAGSERRGYYPRRAGLVQTWRTDLRPAMERYAQWGRCCSIERMRCS